MRYFIVKLGSSGSGKNSELTLDKIRELGVDPYQTIHFDIDVMDVSFPDSLQISHWNHNIIIESTKPVTGILNDLHKLLTSNNYRIVILYHVTPIDILIQRIQDRGEILYGQLENPYYRTYPLHEIPEVVENLRNYVKNDVFDKIEKGLIHELITIRND